MSHLKHFLNIPNNIDIKKSIMWRSIRNSFWNNNIFCNIMLFLTNNVAVFKIIYFCIACFLFYLLKQNIPTEIFVQWMQDTYNVTSNVTQKFLGNVPEGGI